MVKGNTIKMEKLNIVRYAADDLQREKLESQGYKEVSKQKRSADNGSDKA